MSEFPVDGVEVTLLLVADPDRVSTYALLRRWDEAKAALARSRILDPTEI